MMTSAPRRRSTGFTLIELLTVLAVAAILATVAAPSLRTFIDNQRLRNASFDLVTDLLQARSEALSRQRVVVVSPSAAGSDGWSDGWTLNQDTAAGALLTSRTGVAPRLRFRVIDSGGTALSSLNFRNNGRINAATPARIEVNYVAPAPAGVTPSCIRIDATGRARSDKGACS